MSMFLVNISLPIHFSISEVNYHQEIVVPVEFVVGRRVGVLIEVGRGVGDWDGGLLVEIVVEDSDGVAIKKLCYRQKIWVLHLQKYIRQKIVKFLVKYTNHNLPHLGGMNPQDDSELSLGLKQNIFKLGSPILRKG